MLQMFHNTEAVVGRCSVKIFKGFTKFTKKYLCRSLVFKKQPPINYSDTGVSCEFLRTPTLMNFCEWLLTNMFYENKPPPSKGKKDNRSLYVST